MIENLKQHNFLIIDKFLNSEEVDLISNEFEYLYKKNLFKKAKVGKAKNAALHNDIRGDEIYWLDFLTNENAKPAGNISAKSIIKQKLDEIIIEANQNLFLGINDFEGHYAFYPPGGFYKKHLDKFKNDDARALSFVLYLNKSWQPGDGGELCLYGNNNPNSLETAAHSRLQEETITVTPTAGKLVLFLSHLVEHEVLESFKPRRSFTGWFKKTSYT